MFPRIGVFATCTRRVYSIMVVYMSYLAMGAVVFLAVEQNSTSQTKSQTSATTLIKSMVKVLSNENYTNDEIVFIFNWKREEYEKINNSAIVTWDKIFGERFIFSIVILMTIGYGNIRPTTPWSQSLVVLYALFGIPLNLTYIRMIDLQFREGLQKLIIKTYQLIDSSIFVILSVIAYFTFFITLFYYIPATIFNISEDWTYYQSLYFCFVSLGAIGFGDLEPHINFKYFECGCYNLHFVMMFAWLLIGRSFFFMCVNLTSYMIANLINDQLDCKCYKRIAAKAYWNDIYTFTSELNWQLAKYKPKNFSHWMDIENFDKMFVNKPQNVTNEKLVEMLYALEKLDEIIYEELENLGIFGKPIDENTCKPSQTDAGRDISSDSRSLKTSKISQQMLSTSHADYPAPSNSTGIHKIQSMVSSEDLHNKNR